MFLSNRILTTVMMTSFLMTACSLPAPEKKGLQTDESTATFFIQGADGKVVGQNLNSDISIPVSKTISFQVCLKESRRQTAVTRHRFNVRSDGKTQELTSDANGCIQWKEAVEYNHLARAQFVEIQRAIEAVGFQKGARQISFAVNPWEDSVLSMLKDTVADLVPVAQSSDALKGTGKSESYPLWLDDLRLNVEESEVTKNGETLSFELQTVPRVEVTKASGQKILEPINYGDFEVSAFLIHALSSGPDQKEVRRPMTKTMTRKARVAKGVLATDVTLTMENICTMGRLQLALKVSPVNKSLNLKPFEGVFIVKDCTSLKGSTFARLKSVFASSEGALTIDQYLTTTEIAPAVQTTTDPNFSGTTTQPDFYLKNEVQTQELAFSNVDFVGGHPIHRKMVFRAEACMNMPIDQKPIRGAVFQVTTVDGRKISVRSTNTGCINWDDSFEYKYLSPECWVERVVRIENTSLQMDQSFKLQANPHNDSRNFVRDVRFVHQLEKEVRCAQGKPELIMSTFSFDTEKFDYEIDSGMGLKVQKRGYFKIQPTLKIPSLTKGSGFREGEPIPVGSYLLRWAMVDNSVTDYKTAGNLIYSVGKKIVRNQGAGTINEKITFESENLKQIGNRAKILVELVPLAQNAEEQLKENPSIDPEMLIDYDLDLVSNTYEGVVVLANNWEGPPLQKLITPERSLIVHLETVKMYNDAKKKDLLKILSQKASVAKAAGLELMNLNNPEETHALRMSMSNPNWWKDIGRMPAPRPVTPMDINYLKNWVRSGQPMSEVFHGLCKYWFYDHFHRPIRTWDSGQKDASGKPLTKELTAYPRARTDAYRLTSFCNSAFKKDPSQALTIDYYYFVQNPELVRDAKGQALIETQVKDFSLTSQFQMSRSQSSAVTQSVGFDASLGLSFKEIPFVSAGVGVKYGITKSWTKAQGQTSTNTYQSGIALLLESINFRMRAPSYEKCAVVRLSSHLTTGEKALAAAYLDERLTLAEKAKVLSKGIMICDGHLTNRPLEFTESYHVLNQKVSAAQITDTAADSTRPFFFAVRGDSDLLRLLSFLNFSFETPDSVRFDTYGAELAGTRLKDFFLNAAPTQPGVLIRSK